MAALRIEEDVGELELRVQVCVEAQVQPVAKQVVVIRAKLLVAGPVALCDCDGRPLDEAFRDSHEAV